jgi:hypothetical protein
MAKNNLEPDFRTGDEFKKFVADYDKLHREIATKNNWLQ